jgi:hypothetical protein
VLKNVQILKDNVTSPKEVGTVRRGGEGGAIVRDLFNKVELDKVYAAQPLQSILFD